ncbi:hypothetical protein A2300_00455 [Candidatus Falkowbacteria bacterium RIFOXYB2_FULL_35_7]|uniref:Uncharacterized protein n=1 Tax=Candidatus Falkowbacteria bacterium RIFOXYC2_FULL_36_12 TaxID=1798002 RepID=A0A1F5T041_9BACT|nr:MAG: hypothetical protein A2300_00455 [Candidatus Falkowbacteria bacterium RIFOXYB2_FULL_35_7]OGF32318.1 MAG: hypothetical protein A2478_03275 [Candidatus Falkowbacteria bacterium RIFOXYC2_FULL_36_12]
MKKFIYIILIVLIVVPVIGSGISFAADCPLQLESAYKISGNKSVYFITDKCQKRPFNNEAKFFSYFTSWGQVKTIDQSILQSIENDQLGFMPWGPLYNPKYGAVVKSVNDPKVYLLLNEKKYWFASENVFTSLGYKWNWIEDGSDSFIAKYDEGGTINYTDHHPNYTIVKYPDSIRVYQIVPDPLNDGVQLKKHIVNEQAFNEAGYRWDRIVIIPNSEIYSDYNIPSGEISAVSASILEVEISGNVNVLDLMNKDKWQIASVDDNNYFGAKKPIKIERFTVTLDAEDRNKNGQNINDRVLRHYVYLYLPQNMKLDYNYTITGNFNLTPYFYNGAEGYFQSQSSQVGPFTLNFGNEDGFSKAIKVNQFAYSNKSNKRYAYAGFWLGSGGTLNINSKEYTIYNWQNKQIVKSAVMIERGYDDLSGENVYEINLTGLTQGKYYIENSELGRSAIFSVQDNVFDGFYTVARGLYQQRAGTSLPAENTDWNHDLCHSIVYKVDILENWGLDFPAGTSKQNPIILEGGWYDAGDFDRRPVHLNTVEQLLATQEAFNNRLSDNILNIPESGNGLPDLFDEALFGLKLFEKLQESDGGVRGGVQTTGHPSVGSCLDDQLIYYTYSKNVYTSYKFAASAAHAGRLLRDLYGQPARGTELIEKAKKAFTWAEGQSNLGTTSPVERNEAQKQSEINRAKMSATGSLFSATNDLIYQNIFSGLWDELRGPTHYDTIYSAWNFAQAGGNNFDVELRQDVRNRIVESANQFVANIDNNKYRNSRGQGYNIAWGTGTTVTQYAFPIVLAYSFNPAQEYIDAVNLNIDYQLGANPNDMSWITGIGYDSPEYPLHLNSMYDGIEQSVPGLPINGPHSRNFDSGVCEPQDYWQCMVYNGFSPSTNSVPKLKQYSPWARMAPMNEFTVWTDMGYTIASFAFQFAVSGQSAPVNLQLHVDDYPLHP